MVKNDLSKFFVTKTEAAEFSSGLSQISQLVYQTGFNLEEALIYQFGVEKKDLLMQLLRENEINWQDNASLSKYLAELQENIMKMPAITLTLAFVPRGDSLMKISDWLSLNTNRQITIEVGVDRSLVGGAVINYKGKFSDGSIRNKFGEAAYGSNL